MIAAYFADLEQTRLLLEIAELKQKVANQG
jgi:hypothetical protein